MENNTGANLTNLNLGVICSRCPLDSGSGQVRIPPNPLAPGGQWTTILSCPADFPLLINARLTGPEIVDQVSFNYEGGWAMFDNGTVGSITTSEAFCAGTAVTTTTGTNATAGVSVSVQIV